MNYIKQLLFELRERPLVTWVTIIGTALSLFLLMAVYITGSMHTIEISPESNRSRILYAPFFHINLNEGSYSGQMSLEMAENLYGNIEGIERVSYSDGSPYSCLVSTDGIDNLSIKAKRVDSEFWKIFDYDFITGSPFTKAEVDANAKEVIISESVAKELGKGADLTGRDILIEFIPYRIKGIVRDPVPLFLNTWSQIWIPWKDTEPKSYSPECGSTSVFLLMKPSTSPADVKNEVKRRFEVYNKQHQSEGKSIVYHSSPYTAEEQSVTLYSNVDPDFKSGKYQKYFLYVVLLLLPAINLSGINRSRLRRRISELGVRRAYGATRRQILYQLIGENLLLTLIGGLIGLLLCVVFTMAFSHLFIDYINTWEVTTIQAQATPRFSMLFDWKVFIVALIFCFILNILSTGIPAWKASRVNPAEAISGKNT